MRKRLHTLCAQYTNATFYFDRLFPVFARCCPYRMQHIFFLVSSDFVGTFCVWMPVCVCVYRSLRYGSNFVIFSDFSPRMFVNVLLFRKLLAREMSFILGTAKDTFFYSLFRSDRKRTLLGHC